MSALGVSIEDLRGNPAQWEAFSSQGHCVVLAPPGSGKTKLLTTRMAYDLMNEVQRPHGAACITLTNPAANQLREKVSALGVSYRSTLFVGTVHSFALRRIIHPFAGIAGRSELLDLSIASDGQQNSACETAIKQVYGSTADIWLVRSTVKINRKRMADEADWLRSGEGVLEVNRRYVELLRDQGLMDFDDVVAEAVGLVETRRGVRQALNARYPKIYVDEYQDLAPGLDRLIRSLCFDSHFGSALFAVGDPDQAVFGWTGTRPELLSELAGRPGVECVHLEENYRCGGEIVRVANLMRAADRPMTTRRAGGQISTRLCSGGFVDQCQSCIDDIKSAVEDGIALHEIVAICPNNALCEELASAIREAGLPAYVRETQYRYTEATALIEACAAWASRGREVSGMRLSSIKRLWRSLMDELWVKASDIDLVEAVLPFVQHGSRSAVELLDNVMAAGLSRCLTDGRRSEDAAEIERMRLALGAEQPVAVTVAELAERTRNSDRVEVTTMTSSKGLEFDYVLILGMDQKLVPDFRSLGMASKLDEDRRKFYVSITRARDKVHIYYSGFVEWKSGNRAVAGPSMFLAEFKLL